MAHSRVCIITTVHNSSDPRIFHRQACSLAKAGYEVSLIAHHEGPTTLDGVRIIPLPLSKNRINRMLGTSWLAFRLARKEKAYVYHFHDPELLPIAVLLKATAHAKLIYDIHEDVRRQVYSKYWIPRILRRPVSLLYGLAEHLTFAFVDRLVLAEESYVTRYGKGKKVVVVRNYPFGAWANHPHFPQEDREPGRPFTITYVGAITVLRGVYEIIDAFERFVRSTSSQALLYLIGSFSPSGLQDTIASLVKTKGLEQNVVMTGQIPHDQVPRYLTLSDVGVAVLHPDPNYVDSLPTKLYEYMALGLPVIASNFPTWVEVVQGNQCGLNVDPLNPKELADALEALYHDPEARRQFGENGHGAMLEKFNWETESSRLLGMYEGLCLTGPKKKQERVS